MKVLFPFRWFFLFIKYEKRLNKGVLEMTEIVDELPNLAIRKTCTIEELQASYVQNEDDVIYN